MPPNAGIHVFPENSGKHFIFLKKKKQKNFRSYGPPVLQRPPAPGPKVFCALFFKKAPLPSLPFIPHNLLP
jgi:hypothetical protein